MQSVNYSEQLKKRFAENGGKLFFVDGSKSRAFSAVKDIFSAENPASTLCVVNNLWTARQIQATLYSSKSAATVISSLDEFKKLYREVNAEISSAQFYAAKFKEKYSNVIITAEDSNKNGTFLNAELYKAKGKAGEYTDGDRAAYAVSDFFTDAGYAIVVIDNVYEMFNFAADDSYGEEVKKPQNFERLDFMGKTYFNKVDCSYKRLERLVDGSEKAIVISDVIVDKDVVTFYAGANLVHNSFSYKKARALAKSCNFDYEEEADRFYDSLAYGDGNEYIQSLCLRKAKGSKQIIPNGLEEFGRYFSETINFMTKEEIFLRAYFVLSKANSQRSGGSLLSALESEAGIANTICDMLFSDDLKGDLESGLKNAHICKMTAEEFSDFMNLFYKYAFYCDLGEIKDRCSVYRIYHDNSGFEDLMRRSTEAFDSHANSFSASCFSTDDNFKCVAVKNLLKNGQLKLPLLAVANQPNDIAATINQISGFKAVTMESRDACVASDVVTVISYDEFRSLAADISVASAVFFDVISDINLLDTYVKKALNLGKNVNVALLTTYDNMRGMLIDVWQETWLSGENKLVPIRNTEVYIKGERPLDYEEVIKELDEIYRSFKALVDGRAHEKTSDLISRFSSAVSDFTLGVMSHSDEAIEEFDFMDTISSCYRPIFENSISIGSVGREVFSENRVVETAQTKKKKKNKKKNNSITEYAVKPETEKVIFDVCAKKFHETCDYKNRDCFKCNYRGKLILNDFALFADRAVRYFKEAERLTAEIYLLRMQKAGGGYIGGQGTGARNYILDIPKLRELSEEVKDALGRLTANKHDAKTMFFGDYSAVLEIRDAVQSIHYQLFEKYYEQLRSIFEKATNQMKKSFETAVQGAKNSILAL